MEDGCQPLKGSSSLPGVSWGRYRIAGSQKVIYNIVDLEELQCYPPFSGSCSRQVSGWGKWSKE